MQKTLSIENSSPSDFDTYETTLRVFSKWWDSFQLFSNDAGVLINIVFSLSSRLHLKKAWPRTGRKIPRVVIENEVYSNFFEVMA